MAKEHTLPDKKNETVEKHPILRKAVIAVLVSAVLIVVFGTGALVCNNVSFTNDMAFAMQVDAAIEKSLDWSNVHKGEIIKGGNVGLIKMLKEIQTLRPTPLFSDIVSRFMAAPAKPNCWKRLVDPNWPIDKLELSMTIRKENLDNKWLLYAMAPDAAEITPEEIHLFEPERWRGRKLSHQLDALITLRKTKGATKQLDKFIEHLCNRVSNELFFDVLKIDIGQVAFVLRAGFPEKIRRRWVERIVASQLPDGGWNNKRSCFILGRRSVFDFTLPPSNQHDTLLALTVLYLVRYQYPEYFGQKTLTAP
jgi:hypothetical protein